ncbi:hypothetical protein Pint_05935 [Pistacia integerrima]|uniref:Uncharacterized protein n=1 Tax=Pistacia integerrima TaxID=434235 RepID=A0ACC0Z2U6_9ROSI|nr:hypothetical protein Pint_05935 [Pistacia integerrima]
MHAIKGGWVGQTFALAKGNESGGRKSRVRRSKEERKTMVESFIKKYQSSNNGNFPSLTLTHKEVGGSFYTVREIVREIIQENRVLGPAQFRPDELSTNQFDEQYPLGSISKEPQASLNITSKGSHFIPNHDQGTSKEPVAISVGLGSEHEKQRFENEGVLNGGQVVMEIEESAKRISEELQTSNGSHFIPNHDQGVSKEPVAISDGLCSEHEKQRLNNGSQVVMEVEESARRTYEELQTSKPLEVEEGVEKLAAARATVTPISAEVVVETFPLRSVPKTAESSGERSDLENLTETLEENEIEKLDLDSGNGSAPLDQINSSERKGESSAGIVLDKNSNLVDKEVIENSADSQVKSSNFSTTGGTVPNTLVDKEVEVEVSDNDVLTSGMHEKSQRIDDTKEINAANGKIPSGTYSSSRVESRTPKGIVFENKADVQCKESLEKGSNPKLDRIRIESWDEASRNSAARETNPILVAFKSFINAFIKFWSE